MGRVRTAGRGFEADFKGAIRATKKGRFAYPVGPPVIELIQRFERIASRSHCVHQTDDVVSEYLREGIAWRGSASGAAVTDAGRNNPSL